MLGYLVLFFLQIAAGWFGAPVLLKYVPSAGDAHNFVLAALASPIVWATGVLGSYVLKDVGLPSTKTLAWTLIGALTGAALTLPAVKALIPLPSMPPLFLILVMACLGYLVKK
jgi:hypothetical protein